MSAIDLELILFKEYYGMPRGMSTFRLYFRALSSAFFLKVFLEYDSNEKKDPCTVFGCNNDRLFSQEI